MENEEGKNMNMNMNMNINSQPPQNNNIEEIPSYISNDGKVFNYRNYNPYISNSQVPETPGQKIAQSAKNLINSIISKTPLKKDTIYIPNQCDTDSFSELIKYDHLDYISKTEKLVTIENYRIEEDGHISYLIKSNLIPTDLVRRYSDFFALHERLLENWPGIPIPNIPPKVLIKNKDKSVCDMRKKLLEKFMNFILKSIHLFKSREVTIFLKTDITNFKDTIKKINRLSIQEISDNYLFYFNRTDINEYKRAIINKDIYFMIADNINKWVNLVQLAIKKVEIYKDEYEHKLNNTNNVLITLANYEKETMSNYYKNDNSRQIFTNKINKLFLTTLLNYRKENKNPYSDFFDFLEEKELELLSWKTALDSYMVLNGKYFEIKNKIDGLNTKAQEANLGKISLIDMALLKKPPEVQFNAMKEIDFRSVELKQIGVILQILSNKYYSDINYFLNQIYHMFYGCVMNSVFTFKKNDAYTMSLWNDLLIKANKIKKI